jgi:hypothetical protein
VAVATPVTLAATSSAWFRAPAIVAGAVAWLTVPRASATLDGITAPFGDRLVVRRGGRQRTVFDGGCVAGEACDAVRAPAASGDGFAFAVVPDASAAYLARVGPEGRSRVVHADEDPAGSHLVYAASGAVVVWFEKASITARDVVAAGPPTVLVRAADIGGIVTALAVADAGIVWEAADAGGVVHVRRRPVTGGDITSVADVAAATTTLGPPALAEDGTVVVAERIASTAGSHVAVIAYPPVGDPVTLAAGTAEGPGARDVPVVALTGTSAVVRLRAGGATDIVAIDLQTHVARRIVHVGRGAGRLTDPAAAAGEVVWAQTDLLRGAYRRSRVRVVQLDG